VFYFSKFTYKYNIFLINMEFLENKKKNTSKIWKSYRKLCLR